LRPVPSRFDLVYRGVGDGVAGLTERSVVTEVFSWFVALAGSRGDRPA